MLDIILDTLLDSVKLLPFLFITYLLMEELEHKTGGKAKNRIRSAGKSGPVWGALLGVIPQCGFSAAASSLYAPFYEQIEIIRIFNAFIIHTFKQGEF